MLGPDHPHTATSLNKLAILCYYESDYKSAAELMRRALSIYEAVLGADHPDSRSSRESLRVIVAKLEAGTADS